MAKQNISTGSAANDKTGDTLRQAADKINSNFSEIYTYLGGDSTTLGSQITIEDSVIAFEGSSANVFETRLGVIDPTADNVARLPDASGNIVLDTNTVTLTNKTLTTPVISSISNSGTLTLPTSTDTLVGRATTDTLTNKTLTNPTAYRPIIQQSINDSSGNEMLILSRTGSAVNEITISNAATGNPPSISATGTNTNINLNVDAKGTGSIKIKKAAYSAITLTSDTVAASAMDSATFIIGNKGTAIAATLGDGTTVGEYKIFTNKGAGAMTVTPSNFAQGTSFELAQNDGCQCVWDGANWFLIGNQGEITLA